MPVDRGIDGAPGGHHANADGLVLTIHLVPGDRLRQPRVRERSAGDDQQPARILVEPMDNARPRQQGEVGVVVQECVLERRPGVAGAGMHDQAGRLIEHDHGLVLVDDLEVDGLGRHLNLGLLERLDAHHFPAPDQVPGARLDAVDKHPPGLDPVLQPGSGEVGEQDGQRLVQALSPVALRDAVLEEIGHRKNIRYTPAPCISRWFPSATLP